MLVSISALHFYIVLKINTITVNNILHSFWLHLFSNSKLVLSSLYTVLWT